MSKAAAKSALKLPATYEEAQTELEQLVKRLESGDMPLEELLTGYQRGSELLRFCREKLQAVEDQIKVLDAGNLKPWTPQ
jgi:exodeoxyribonuclease VII small subunit